MDLTQTVAARRFAALTLWLHSLLPDGLARFLPQTFIGFALINSTTFLIDIALLSLSVRVLGVPYALAVSGSFAVAAGIAFGLNKVLNFRSHGQLGTQSGKYLLVLVSNFVIWLLGFSTLLNHIGTPPEIARVSAGLCEGLYIYLLSRLWVFRRT